MYSYLLYLTKNWAVAEGLSRARRSRQRSRNGADSTLDEGRRAWLLAIARTTALDWFRSDARRRKREERAEMSERRDEPGSFGEAFSAELRGGASPLSAGEREVVALRIVLDLDGEETARLLGISVTAVSTRLSRALSSSKRG